MDSTESKLNRSAKQLNLMVRDLQAMLAANQLNWLKPSPARSTLGGDLTVTPWRFASSFLSVLGEWRSCVAGWRRLFGETQSPDSWQATERRCAAIAEKILARPDFHDAINVGIGADLLVADAPSDRRVTAESAFSEVMALREREHLVRSLQVSPNWTFAKSTLADLEQTRRVMESQVADLPEEAAAALDWHLRHYRGALLLANSLHPNGTGYWPSRFNASFENKMNQPNINSALDETARQRLSDFPELLQAVEKLAELCGELGFENLCEHWTTDDLDLFGSANAGVLEIPMNVIPGSHNGACCQLVTVLARVAGKRYAQTKFRRILTQLKTHLLHCQGTTKLAVLITDWWDVSVFEQDHAAELSAWRRNGVEIIVLLVGQTNSAPTPLRIRW